MKKTITTTALALVALLAFAGVAEARTVAYSGKVTGGHKIKFKRSGNKVKRIVTGVPMVCLTASTGYANRSGVELFNPPGSFSLGRETKRKKLQRAAMWYGKVTKYYTVEARKVGRKIKGELHVTFAYNLPVFDYYGARLVPYICRSDVKFSARPRG